MRPIAPVITNRKKRLLRQAALIASLVLLLAVTLVAVTSFTAVNRLMKSDVKPIPPYATNVFKSFESVSFLSKNRQHVLRGWLIMTDQTLRGTVIIVHHQGGCRLPYGLDSAKLYQKLSVNGFQTLAFDLRHSGESTGEMSSFGCAEADDVLQAIEWAAAKTGGAPLILYAFGSGTAAVMRALCSLREALLPEIPETRAPAGTAGTDAGISETRPDTTDQDTADALEKEKIRSLYNRIGGLILDTPARSSDAFLKAAVREHTHPAFFWLPDTVPAAARFSLREYAPIDFYAPFTSFLLPVMIAEHETNRILPASETRAMIDERLRLHPDLTQFYQAPGTGFLTAYPQNPEKYECTLFQFLDDWFPPRGLSSGA